MVVDASALIDIVGGAPNAERFATIILNSGAIMAAPSVLEARIVLHKFLGKDTEDVVAWTLSRLGITIVPFGSNESTEAGRAYDQFGVDRHAPGLTLAECSAYAVAKIAGQPLLYSGQRFSQTDIASALKRAK